MKTHTEIAEMLNRCEYGDTNHLADAVLALAERLEALEKMIRAPNSFDRCTPEELPFDPTKPVRQRCGRPAFVLTIHNMNAYPVSARFLNPNGEWTYDLFTLKGEMSAGKISPYDLVNIPDPVPAQPEPPEGEVLTLPERWVAVKRMPEPDRELYTGVSYLSKKYLNISGAISVIKLPAVRFTRGEGLEEGEGK